MEKLKEDLMKHFENEMDDIEAYLEMSVRASENGHSALGGILHDIARDEYTHAMAIYNALGHHGPVPEKIETMWKEIHAKYHNI